MNRTFRGPTFPNTRMRLVIRAAMTLATLFSLFGPHEPVQAASYKVTVGYEGSELPVILTPGRAATASAAGSLSPDDPAVNAGFPPPLSRPTAAVAPMSRTSHPMQPVSPSNIGAQSLESKVGLPPSSLGQTLVQNGKATAADIQFDKDSPALRSQAEPALREILGVLQQNPEMRLLIEGHTDNQGRNNGPLSQMRADAVRNWLINHGINPIRLRARGFGDSRPVASNDTVEGRARNRRVDLVVE